MSNLTITVDDQLIKLARVRAIQQGTSLSAKVREFLSAYAAGVSRQEVGDATAQLLGMIDGVRAEVRQVGAQQASASTKSTKSTSGAKSPKLRADAPRTLRSEIYDGDFQASGRTGNIRSRRVTGGT